MRKIYITAGRLPGKEDPLEIAKRGENAVTEIVFDYSFWVSQFGPGAIQLMVKRPGDADAYPVVLDTENGAASWVVSDVDANVAGIGRSTCTR